MSRPVVELTFLRTTKVPPRTVQPKDLRDLAAFVLGAEGVRTRAELALDLTNHARIQSLNRRFRGVDRTTDVISFRNDLPVSNRKQLPAKGTALEGDIAINVPQAALQAKGVGHPLRREIRLLWIHALLHLMGYTDYDPKPRRRMFKRQNELLRRWESRPRS